MIKIKHQEDGKRGTFTLLDMYSNSATNLSSEYLYIFVKYFCKNKKNW